MRKPLAILLLGTALTLSAEQPRFGVQAALALPANDLSNNAYLGLQLGGHAQWDFRQGHGLIARADLTFYGSNNNTNVTDLGFAADYTYHIERRPTGFYFLAGLSQDNYHTSYPNFTHNDSSLGIDLGAGYDVDRHLGFQGRYTTHNTSNDGTYGSFNLGVTYTF